MSELLFRCSSLGKLMTDPRTKSETLSETAKSYIQDLFKEREFGIYKEFSSRYTDKGLEMEDEAIQFASEVLGWDFVVKNETRFNNEWITGEPDINTDSLLADIKCSWNAFTFPLFEKEIPNKDYYYQLQVYMHLTGCRKAVLTYVLLNTPEELTYEEKHNYDAMDKKYRIKTFEIEYSEKVIADLKERVTNIRTFITENYE